MSKKRAIWIFMGIGSVVGGYIPALWGADMFSFSSIIFSTIGGFLGIYLGFTIGD